MRNYHELLVWKRAFEFSKLAYRLSSHFPKEEIYGLTSQLKRAAVSVPANIAEGACRKTNKDFCRFLYYSSGSLSECEVYIEFALDMNFITKEQFDYIDPRRREVGYLLSRFIKSIE